jgi:hypothetical protein
MYCGHLNSVDEFIVKTKEDEIERRKAAAARLPWGQLLASKLGWICVFQTLRFKAAHLHTLPTMNINYNCSIQREQS